MADPTHSSPVHSVARTQSTTPITKTQTTQAASYAELMIQQDETMEKLTQVPQNNFNPALLNRNARPLRERIPTRGKEDAEVTKTERAQEEEEGTTIHAVEKVDEAAEAYHKQQPELEKNELLLLRGKISKRDSPEEILRKVLNSFSDVTLADEALNFLIETSTPDVAENVRAAKEMLNQGHAREIKAGKNIESEVNEASSAGLGTQNQLRDLYRELTGNPRPPATLFEELAEKYQYSELRGVIKFLLHSLGADLKAKGPSIAKGELYVLFKEVRTLQAILGIYLFFMSRTPLINAEFTRMGFSAPPSLNFESLAKVFVKFVQDRFPSPEKAQMLLSQFNLTRQIPAQIMILQQMRDAVNNIAKSIYRNDQHKKDVLMSLLTCLSDLEDLLEEAEEAEEEEQRSKVRRKPIAQQDDENSPQK